MSDTPIESPYPVTLEIEGPVATITLNQPKRLNALNPVLLESLAASVRQVEENPDLRVVLIRGAGRAFAAGADIKAMSAMSPIEAMQFSRSTQELFTRIEQLPQVTIALVQGYALGGGNELAMSADLRIAAQGTRFGQPEVGLGIIPGFGGTQRLARIVGEGRALELCLLAEQVDADRAERIGLVNEVVPADRLAERGRELAARLLELSGSALSATKESVYRGERMTIDDGLAFESKLMGVCFATPDRDEGLAAFLSKRRANFS